MTLKVTPKVALKMSLKIKVRRSSEKVRRKMAVIGDEMAVIYRRGLLYVNITKGDSHSLRNVGYRLFENEE